MFKALAIGAILMIIGGVVEIAFGVKAERKGLEAIAKPLTEVTSSAKSAVKGPAAATTRRPRPRTA